MVVEAGQSLERAYREEATRIRAALAARTGDVGLAEDAVQDAFVEAIEHWPRAGVPPNPGGWLATTARRKALDRLRRDRTGAEKLALLPARKTLRQAAAEVRLPDPDELGGRLAGVLAVVYLFFNEGYLASSGREPARRDLAAQAIALTRTLHRLMPREPEVLGLLALLLMHESRAAARFDGWGRLIRLKDQDRRLWDQDLAKEAASLLDRAMALRHAGPYQVQAAIAALHAQAPCYEETDWRQIRLLYSRLQQ